MTRALTAPLVAFVDPLRVPRRLFALQHEGA
jgi:hypothetical protein